MRMQDFAVSLRTLVFLYSFDMCNSMSVFKSVLFSRLDNHLAAFSLLCLAVFCFLLVWTWNTVRIHRQSVVSFLFLIWFDLWLIVQPLAKSYSFCKHLARYLSYLRGFKVQILSQIFHPWLSFLFFDQNNPWLVAVASCDMSQVPMWNETYQPNPAKSVLSALGTIRNLIFCTAPVFLSEK